MSTSILDEIRFTSNNFNSFIREVDLSFYPKLNFCQRNILSMMGLYMRYLFAHSTYNWILGKKTTPEEWNNLDENRNIINEYNLVNHTFHEISYKLLCPYYKYIEKMFSKIYRERSAIHQIYKTLTDIYNMVALQLVGIQISCEYFEPKKQIVCAEKLEHCITSSSNTFILFMNPYYTSPDAIECIKDAIKHITPKTCIALVDFTYFKDEDNKPLTYDDLTHSLLNPMIERFCKVYFIHCDGIDLGEYDISPAEVIQCREDYKKVMKKWQKKRANL